jgi:integrase
MKDVGKVWADLEQPSSMWSLSCGDSGQGRGRTADLPIFSRTLVPTELPGRMGAQMSTQRAATPTGLEPATFAVTGRRANQLRHGASAVLCRTVPPTGFEPALPP